MYDTTIRLNQRPTNHAESGVTQAMLEELPPPIQRYLIYTGIVGTPIPEIVRLKQHARIRETIEKPWMVLTAKQVYTIHPPSFIWVGTVKKLGLPLVRATDSYQAGKGRLQLMVGGLFPLFTATGPEMDQGEMMRYLNEMTLWFPAALLNQNVSFESIDDTSANVTLTDTGKQVSARLFVNAEGQLSCFEALRYRSVGKTYALEKWSTPILSYGTFAGLRLAASGSAIYHLKTGDLSYIEVTLLDLSYECAKKDAPSTPI